MQSWRSDTVCMEHQRQLSALERQTDGHGRDISDLKRHAEKTDDRLDEAETILQWITDTKRLVIQAGVILAIIVANIGMEPFLAAARSIIKQVLKE